MPLLLLLLPPPPLLLRASWWPAPARELRRGPEAVALLELGAEHAEMGMIRSLLVVVAEPPALATTERGSALWPTSIDVAPETHLRASSDESFGLTPLPPPRALAPPRSRRPSPPRAPRAPRPRAEHPRRRGRLPSFGSYHLERFENLFFPVGACINPSRGVSNALFCRCADAPTALGQRCHLVHQTRHGLIVHCRP